MSINKELYDEYVKKSFFTDKNFSGKYSPKSLSDNMITYTDLKEFHYQTSLYLNLYSTLHIELLKKDDDNNNNIIKFADTIENLNIVIDNTTGHRNDGDTSKTYKISEFNPTSNVFTFYVKTFEAKTSTQEHLYSAGTLSTNVCYDSGYSNVLSNNIPIFGTNKLTLVPTTSFINNLMIKSTDDDTFTNISLNKSNSLSSIPEENKIIKTKNNSKLKEIIEEILSQTPENMLGYLLYKKIYYNIILYNISIQNIIYINYLYENGSAILRETTSSNIKIAEDLRSCSGFCLYTSVVCQTIKENLNNITVLNKNNFQKDNSSNDYIIEKNNYKNKINVLNNLRDEYVKIQDKLNISTKLYNQQYINYNSIKSYATFVIIALIIIIIAIISISIFPIFSNDTKNAIYIILLVSLIVITFIYYTSFKYVNMYEKFAISPTFVSAITTIIINGTGTLITMDTTSNTNRNNHAKFYNLLLPYINDYSNAVNDLLNNLRMNVYTIGSKSFSQDGNIYLYNLYLEKKRQIENNKIKLTNLFNMIEIIKKQISYLFNVVFFIACFAIILLICLVIYSTTPQLYIFVIILCIILITILMIYFAFAVIQPTRMIMNKNYWAIVNPSQYTIGKL